MMVMKNVEIKVIANDGSIVNQYSLEYSTALELSWLIKEAREVWFSYHIVAETDLFTQSFSHTYGDEVLMGCK